MSDYQKALQDYHDALQNGDAEAPELFLEASRQHYAEIHNLDADQVELINYNGFIIPAAKKEE